MIDKIADNFFVINLFPSAISAASLSLNSATKEVLIFEHRQFFNLDQLKIFIDKKNFPSDTFFIVGLDSETAITDYCFLDILRAHSSQPINENELEQIINRLIDEIPFRKNTNNFMPRQLHLHNFMLDEHVVTDPLGLSGKNLRVYFSKTLLRKNFIEIIAKIIPNNRHIFIGETGSYWASLIARVLLAENGIASVPSLLFAAIYYNRTDFILFKNKQIKHLSNFAWGEKNITSCLIGRLAIGQSTARSLISLYNQNRLSPDFSSRIESFWKAEINEFRDYCSKLTHQEKVDRLCLFSPVDLPFKESSLNTFEHRLLVDNSFIGERSGFQLKLKQGVDDISLLASLGMILELQNIPINSWMNKIVNRRLRWRNAF